MPKDQSDFIPSKLDIENRCVAAADGVLRKLYRDKPAYETITFDKNQLLRLLTVTALEGYAIGSRDGVAATERFIESQQSWFVRMFRSIFH